MNYLMNNSGVTCYTFTLGKRKVSLYPGDMVVVNTVPERTDAAYVVDVFSDISWIGRNSVVYPVIVKSSDYNITEDEFTVIIDGSSNPVNLELLLAQENPGRVQNIKCINNTYTCTVVSRSGETIDGESSVELLEGETITIQSDGYNWHII